MFTAIVLSKKQKLPLKVLPYMIVIHINEMASGSEIILQRSYTIYIHTFPVGKPL